MKKLLIFSWVSFFIIITADTCLASGPYFSSKLAVVVSHDSDWIDSAGNTAEITSKTGAGFSLAIGDDLFGFRSDLELAYRFNSIDEISILGYSKPSSDSNVSSTAFIGSIYKDFNKITINNTVSPFIGAGIGIANVHIKFEGERDDVTAFAYQFAAGVSYRLSETANVDLSYRYFATTDLDYNGLDIEYGTSNIMVGVRMNF